MFMSKIQRQGLPTPGWVGAADSGEGAPLSAIQDAAVVCAQAKLLFYQLIHSPTLTCSHRRVYTILGGAHPLNFITAPLKITIVKAVEIKMYFLTSSPNVRFTNLSPADRIE